MTLLKKNVRNNPDVQDVLKKIDTSKMLGNITELETTVRNYVNYRMNWIKKFETKLIEKFPHFDIFVEKAINFLISNGKSGKINDFMKKLQNNESIHQEMKEILEQFYIESTENKKLIHRAIEKKFIANIASKRKIDNKQARNYLDQMKRGGLISYDIAMLLNNDAIDKVIISFFVHPATKNGVTTTTKKTSTSPVRTSIARFNCNTLNKVEDIILKSIPANFTHAKKNIITSDRCIAQEICQIAVRKKFQINEQNLKRFITPYIDYAKNFVRTMDEVDEMYFDLIAERLSKTHRFTEEQADCAVKFMNRSKDFKDLYHIDILFDDQRLDEIALKVAQDYKSYLQ